MKSALAALPKQTAPNPKPSRRLPQKHALYHAPLDLQGECRGYEAHMRRGSCIRSVYGYLLAILKRHPNTMSHVWPSKRRIQNHTYRWIRVNRRKWTMTDENYSRRQVYYALRILQEIGAITLAQGGWILRSHAHWTVKDRGICHIREARTAKNLPVYPRKYKTVLSILNSTITSFRKG